VARNGGNVARQGNQDRGRTLPLAPDLHGDVGAVDPRQVQIHDHDVVLIGQDERQTRLAFVGNLNSEFRVSEPEHGGQHHCRIPVIVDD
jgi:hypothetical protein